MRRRGGQARSGRSPSRRSHLARLAPAPLPGQSPLAHVHVLMKAIDQSTFLHDLFQLENVPHAVYHS